MPDCLQNYVMIWNHRPNTLLLHTEVRWLSKGKTLERLLLLQNEIRIFLSQNNSELVRLFHNHNWMMKLCYLADVLEKINQLSLFLQGENTNTFLLKSKIEALTKKVNIWQQKTENDFYEMFLFAVDFLASNGVEPDVIKPIIISHSTSLNENLPKYFLPKLDDAKLDWIQNPFIVQNQDIEHLPLNSQKESAKLSCD